MAMWKYMYGTKFAAHGASCYSITKDDDEC